MYMRFQVIDSDLVAYECLAVYLLMMGLLSNAESTENHYRRREALW